tara:strand:+ start:104 stop:229 length:126 start_codon:yes stop_codon:yes gene_type:complete
MEKFLNFKFPSIKSEKDNILRVFELDDLPKTELNKYFNNFF